MVIVLIVAPCHGFDRLVWGLVLGRGMSFMGRLSKKQLGGNRRWRVVKLPQNWPCSSRRETPRSQQTRKL